MFIVKLEEKVVTTKFTNPDEPGYIYRRDVTIHRFLNKKGYPASGNMAAEKNLRIYKTKSGAEKAAKMYGEKYCWPDAKAVELASL